MSFFKRPPRLDDDGNSDVENVDPNLRLRTTLTAHSTIAESIRSELRQQRRKRSLAARTRSTTSAATAEPQPRTSFSGQRLKRASTQGQATAGHRRMVYVNLPLPDSETNSSGDPVVRYARNKVRTSKYTIITSFPKNLYEQFRRVANLYFLALVVLQVFPVFGAAAPQIAMVPLVIILSITAAKDGIEDYRRASLDDEVNNSARPTFHIHFLMAQPQPTRDPRSWIERMLGLGTAPGKVTRGSSASERASEKRDERERDRTRSLEDYPKCYYGREWNAGKPDIPTPDAEHGHCAAASHGSDVSSGTSYHPPMADPGPTPTWETHAVEKARGWDIVLLRDNDQVPADTIVLATSDPDGLAYVETKNLDGETNLKLRRALRAHAGYQAKRISTVEMRIRDRLGTTSRWSLCV
ncbi:phospholipid-translocating P-type ATPase [Ceratobasidium sp. AG-Ba]|nr:phospholipid-translocating P-type ATPase [Ceratobasidium sp. AG-Ba]